MDRKAALATAAGLVLVVAGAASALTSAWTIPADSATTTAPAATAPTVVTEYVDEAGNPVEPPARIQAESVIMTRSPLAEEVIVYADTDPIYVDAPAAPASTDPAQFVDFDDEGDDDHEDDHEDEYEDEDEHEDEGEDEDGAEFEHEDEDEDESDNG